MRLLLAFSFSTFLVFSLVSQDTDSQSYIEFFNLDLLALEDTLSDLGQVILEDPVLLNRQTANFKFSTLFEKTMKVKGAYAHDFECLFNVSKLNGPNDDFKIYTWQLFEGDDSYVYYGYILHKDGRVIQLKDQSHEYYTPEFEVGDKDHWYGSLYYNIFPFTAEDSTSQYLVFGYDGSSLMERRKIIDVLSFDESGNPTFGSPVFNASKESRGHPPVMYRVLMDYFAGTKISCNYEEIHNSVVYDHLIFKKTQYGEFMIPDGSYEGYVYEGGKWMHVAKMFHHSYGDKNFPVPEPVLSREKQKDIFGKDAKRATKNVNRDEKLYKKARENNKKKKEAEEGGS